MAVVALLCAGNGWHGFDSTRGQAMACLLNCTALIGLLAIHRLPLRWWRAAFPVLAFAVLAIAWACAATVIGSGGLPDYAYGKIAAYLSGLAALLCGAIVASTRRGGGHVIDYLLFVNVVLTVAGLFARQAGAIETAGWTLDRAGRFAGLIGNPNATAAVAAAFALLAFSRVGIPGVKRRFRLPLESERMRTLLYLPILFLMAGTVLATASRTAALALAAALVIDVIERWTRGRRGLAGENWPTFVAVGMVVSLTLVIGGTLRERLDALAAGGSDRVATWSHLIDLAARSPLLGYGLGSFPMVNAHFLDTPRFAQANWAINSPHNVLLQWVLQAGLPYALLMLTAVLLGVRQIRRGLAHHWLRDDWIVVGMLALILTVAMVDVPLDLPGTVSVTLFLAGLLWGHALERAEVGVLLTHLQSPQHEGPVTG